MFGRVVLVLSRKPLGDSPGSLQVIHTGVNVTALTANKHLVAMELDLLRDTQSEGREVFKNRAQVL